MPNRHTTLTSLFSDIADQLRAKGLTGQIVADNFDTAISSIQTDPSGGTTATAGDLLLDKTAYSDHVPITGTMPNNGAVTNTISTQGGTYSIPAGYHNGSGVVTASIPNGSQGTPTASKSVSGNMATITPSCTDTTGYIVGQTISGSPLTVEASELVSGNIELTQSTSTDVTNYATATVQAGSATISGSVQQSAPTFSRSGNVVTANVASKTLSATPTVSAGWVDSGTAGTFTMTANSNTYTIPTQTKSTTVNGTVSPDSGYLLESVTVSIPIYDGSVS